MEERHIDRAMEENLESRNKPIHLWSVDFQQGWQDHSTGKNSLQQMMRGQLDSCMQKNEFGPPHHTI